MKLCECGCGEEVPYTSKRRKDDQPRFRQGHHVRVMASCHAHKNYTPTADEIPSGQCECGCGKQTSICSHTIIARRHFFGHPLPYCSGHSVKKLREQSHQWKGGRRMNDHGYIVLYMPEHPNANSKGYVAEHRFIMSELLGRPLTRKEHVHHKNEDKADNRLENLELLSESEHRRLHNLTHGIIPPSRKGVRKLVS